MDDSRTIVPKIVFLLITWERVFFYKNTEQNCPFVLKSNQLFLVPNHERNKLDLNV